MQDDLGVTDFDLPFGVLEVNAVSKWNASSETTVGLKGGAMRFSSSASHEMDAKNGCRFTLSMPSGPAGKLMKGPSYVLHNYSERGPQKRGLL